MSGQQDEASVQKELEDVLERAKPGFDRFKKRTIRAVFIVVPLVLVAALAGGHSRWDDWSFALSLAAAAIGVLGSVIGLFGALAPDLKTTSRMSMMMWGGNHELLAGLLKAQFAAKVGIPLIMFGFILFCVGQGFQVLG